MSTLPPPDYHPWFQVWDDQAVWNVDFCTIFPRIHVEEMNDLERTFVEMLEFNVNVDSAVYTKYYFALRALCDHPTYPNTPLTKRIAQKIEVCSHKASALIRRRALRNAKSLDFELELDFKTPAVLEV